MLYDCIILKCTCTHLVACVYICSVYTFANCNLPNSGKHGRFPNSSVCCYDFLYLIAYVCVLLLFLDEYVRHLHFE